MENTTRLYRTNPIVEENTKRRIAFIILESVFVMAIIAIYFLTHGNPPIPPTWMWFVLSLATFRAARTLSFNEVGEPIRGPFTETRPDSCKAGQNVQPKTGASGMVYVIGSLLTCPICTGQWSALILYGLWAVAPAIAVIPIIVLGMGGASEFLHWGAEKLEWEGRAARCVAGQISPDKE